MRVRELLSNAKTAHRDVNTPYQASYPVEGTVLVWDLFLEGFRVSNKKQYRRQLRLLFAPSSPSASPTEPSQDHWLKVWVKFDKELEERSEPLSFQIRNGLDLPVMPSLLGMHFSGGSPSRGARGLTRYGIRPERLPHSISAKDRKSVRFQTPAMSHSETRQQGQPANILSLS